MADGFLNNKRSDGSKKHPLKSASPVCRYSARAFPKQRESHKRYMWIHFSKEIVMGPVRGRTTVTRSQEWAARPGPGLRARPFSSKFGVPRVQPEPECRDQVTVSDSEWDSVPTTVTGSSHGASRPQALAQDGPGAARAVQVKKFTPAPHPTCPTVTDCSPTALPQVISY
jgi:hypothetical protein